MSQLWELQRCSKTGGRDGLSPAVCYKHAGQTIQVAVGWELCPTILIHTSWVFRCHFAYLCTVTFKCLCVGVFLYCIGAALLEHLSERWGCPSEGPLRTFFQSSEK